MREALRAPERAEPREGGSRLLAGPAAAPGGLRIGLASADWSRATSPPSPGGSGWYRAALPARMLAARGHTVVHGVLTGRPSGEFCVRTWDGRDHAGLDLVILQRFMGADVLRDMPRAQALGQLIANDLDDWFWGLDQRNRAFWSSHPKVNPGENRDLYAKIIAASDAVVCSTPYLADRVRALFPGLDVSVIRNAIDAERYEAQMVRATDELVVGWAGATSWRSGDLELLQGVLGPWLARHGGRFLHAGHQEQATPAGELLGLSDYWQKPMVPIGRYPELLAGFDVGIVPLADAPFNLAKSAIKGMEYAAAGIPFIASDLPEYRWFGAGELARRPKDWIRALDRLLDPATRAAHAARARTRLARETTIERAVEWDRWARRILKAGARRRS